MEYIVKGCNNCFFRDGNNEGTHFYCQHPNKYLGDIFEDDNGNLILPSDCPLIKEPITIKLDSKS